MSKLLAVIHLRDNFSEGDSEGIDNASKAIEGGADGVFLINQHPSSDIKQVNRVGEELRKSHPNTWIGANILGESMENISKTLSPIFNGLWIDDSGIDEDTTTQKIARNIRGFAVIALDLKGLYFGGVAFKYQKQVKDFAKVAKLATEHIDVITTSGPGTGIAADVEKIKIMKEAIGKHPLALASGVTAENVHQYLPYVDYFLVGTYLESSPYKISVERVRQLKTEIEKYENN